MATKVPNGGGSGGGGGGGGSGPLRIDVYVDDAHALPNGQIRDGATVMLAGIITDAQVGNAAFDVRDPSGAAIDAASITCDTTWGARSCAQFVAAVPGTYKLTLTATKGTVAVTPYVRNLPVIAIATLQQTSGRVTFLRAHDVGSGWGPPNDSIDVEVVTKLDSSDHAFGFQLRSDGNQAARRAMFDLLRDAYAHDWRVTIDYSIIDLKTNGVIMRVALAK
jgi:hypothetical protein